MDPYRYVIGEAQMKSAKFTHGLGLGILVVFSAGALSAQSSGQSTSDPLAAAAKRAQDSKKDQSKTARVWDNDSIPKAGHEISIVGSNDVVADGTNPAVAPAGIAGASPDGAAGGANPAAPAAGPAPNQADLDAKIQAQISNAKESIASMKTDLDLMQRTQVLDSQMYYSKPDYANDRAGARKLTDEQAKIADKQQAIDEAEKKLAELETLLKASPQNNPPVNRD
jgi:hypothetical protein